MLAHKHLPSIANGPRLLIRPRGFVGMGDHYVAGNPADVRITYNDSDKKWHATGNATADQLKAAPEFKYNGRWNASKS